MKTLIHILLLLFPIPAHAFEICESWTWADTTLSAAYVVTRAADWSQTRKIEDHQGLEETNPMLGEHPDNAEIDQYFAWSTVGAIGLTMILPKSWRRSLLFGLTGANVYAVVNNHRLGLSVGGKF